MGARKSTLVRLDAGDMAYCISVNCSGLAVYKALTPKSGAGARGGTLMTRYLCAKCGKRFLEHFPKTEILTPKS